MSEQAPQGFTIIDHLIAQAMVEAFHDEDFSETIEEARRLAELSERRESRSQMGPSCHKNPAQIDFSAVSPATPLRKRI